MSKIHKIFTPFVIFALFLSALFLFSLHPISESDTGFIIKTGEYIWNTKSVPHGDIFSYTAPSAQWIPHYWLVGIIFFFLHSFCGVWGIILFVGCVALCTYFMIFKTVRLHATSFFVPLLFSFFFFFLTFKLWSARPQIFSYFFASFLIYLIFLYRKNRGKHILFIIPFVLWFWANMHAGVILGIGIVILFFLVECFEKKYVRVKELFGIGVSMGVGILSTLVNPNGLQLLLYSNIIAPVAEILGVMEWQSILKSIGTWQAKVFIVFMCGSILFILRTAYKEKKSNSHIDTFSLGIACMAFFLPFISIRHVIFFPILIFPIFIWSLEKYFQEKKISLEVFLRERFFMTLISILFLFIIAGSISFGRELEYGTVNARTLPVGVSNFIIREGVNGPFFNLENGGYFIWRLWPNEKVFLDGRNEVYAGDPVNEYISIARQDGNWQELVDTKYKINGFILWYRPPIDLYANNLVVRLMREKGFSLVYWDDAAILLLKNNDENKRIIKQFGYSVINPFRDPFRIQKKDLEKAMREIRLARGFSPDSSVLSEYEELLRIFLAETEKKLVQ